MFGIYFKLNENFRPNKNSYLQSPFLVNNAGALKTQSLIRAVYKICKCKVSNPIIVRFML